MRASGRRHIPAWHFSVSVRMANGPSNRSSPWMQAVPAEKCRGHPERRPRDASMGLTLPGSNALSHILPTLPSWSLINSLGLDPDSPESLLKDKLGIRRLSVRKAPHGMASPGSTSREGLAIGELRQSSCPSSCRTER